MNKKGQGMGFIFILFGIMIIYMLLSVCVMWASIMNWGEECNYKTTSKLIAWNGITDKDTGLFSGGSVSRDTLLFENGMVIDYRLIDIKLGENYKIYNCKAFMNSQYYKIEK